MFFLKINALNDRGTAFGKRSFWQNDILKNKCSKSQFPIGMIKNDRRVATTSCFTTIQAFLEFIPGSPGSRGSPRIRCHQLPATTGDHPSTRAGGHDNVSSEQSLSN